MFLADWADTLFIHFRFDPTFLQPRIPLELDIFEGSAFISLVAFTQRRLRPRWGGPATEMLSTPLAQHAFLNLRTYVRQGNQRGIYFMAEWISNRLAVLIGPAMYGLPYRLGRLDYRTSVGRLSRRVRAESGEFFCRASWDGAAAARICPAGSEAEFLLERYAAFTLRDGVLRKFQIAHAPWRQTAAEVRVDRSDLLGVALPPPCAAHYSPGLVDVRIGRPERLADANPHESLCPNR
jgi:hypothetical protein